jgi:hypothetical protein
MSKTVIVKQAPPKNGVFKLGLEKYGESMFNGADSSFPIPIKNNKFVHGLSEADQKVVEQHYGLQFDNPEHKAAWGNMSFTMRHTLNALDPKNNPEDLLTLSVLKQMSLAASSLEELKDNPMVNYNFVISDDDQEIEAKASVYERTDEAIVALNTLKKSEKHLLAVSRLLIPRTMGVGSSKELAYLKLREFIEGLIVKNKGEALTRFEQALEMEKEKLYLITDFREAYARNIIRKDKKNGFYNPITEASYGKTEEEALKYLADPKNQGELGTGRKDDEQYTIRYQLNHK